ncbi:MAG TPA: ABC transporter permease [Nocardioides sp.]
MGDLATSGHEFVVGLALGAIGIPAGLIVGSVRRLGLALDPIINGIYSTPTLALTPLFVIWFGLGIESKVAIVFIMAFFPLLINTAAGVKTVDDRLIQAARSFGAGRIHLYRDVIFPGTLPFIISGIRLAIGRAIIGVVIGEFIASVEGIGYRIRAAAASFKTDEYLAGVMILIVISIVLNVLLKALERRLAPWRTVEN